MASFLVSALRVAMNMLSVEEIANTIQIALDGLKEEGMTDEKGSEGKHG